MKKGKFLVCACSLLALSCSSIGTKSKGRVEPDPNNGTALNNGENGNISGNIINIADENSIIRNSVQNENEVEVSIIPKKSNIKIATSVTDLPLRGENQLIVNKIKGLKEKQKELLNSGKSENIKTVSVQNALIDTFKNWEGTKYAFGGDSSRGIDCSALTRRVYREVFSHELPRITTEQVKTGRRVNLVGLKPGDILYFKPEGRTNHTAVYLGNSLFINASTKRGVILSSLESPYWEKYFQYGVRVNNLNT